jgi:TetR/AcrR family transcriptional repressor of nem operon
MARPTTFDRDEVVARAMNLFWRKGYRATSTRDLVEHLGINQSSFYNTFDGGKRGLYLEALDRYRRAGLIALRRQLREKDSPLASIRYAFEEVAEEAIDRRDGCFMTNATVEEAPHDAATNKRAKESLAAMREAFAEATRRAQAAGEVGEERDARALGYYLTNAYNGIRVTAKADPEEAVVRGIVEETLRGLRCTG